MKEIIFVTYSKLSLKLNLESCLFENTELCQACVMTVYTEHKIEVDFQIKNKTLKYVNPHLIKAHTLHFDQVLH